MRFLEIKVKVWRVSIIKAERGGEWRKTWGRKQRAGGRELSIYKRTRVRA